jgi:8-oxo-dGTP pyrophosphatase MutT (NUDIX family)
MINIPYSGTYYISSQRDQDLADRVIRLIEGENLAFSKQLLTGHITASAFLLNMKHDKVLLTHHAKLGKWLQLGGHCDGIKDPKFAALKEAYEESGLPRIDHIFDQILDIDIHEIPEHKDVQAHLHYDIRYALETDERHPFIVSDESNDLKWIPLDELEDYNPEPSLIVMRDKLQTLRL